jgi:hypothetical protein
MNMTSARIMRNSRLFAGLAPALLLLLEPPAGAQTGPLLGITNTPPEVSIFWPAASNGFALQWTTNLTLSNSWRPFPTAPSAMGESSVVSLPVTNGLLFFRLAAITAPAVVTTNAIDTNFDSAVLRGTVDPGGDFLTTAYFEYKGVSPIIFAFETIMARFDGQTAWNTRSSFQRRLTPMNTFNQPLLTQKQAELPAPAPHPAAKSIN